MFGKLGNIANTFLHAFEQIKSTTLNLTANFRTPNFNNTAGQNAALEHLALNFDPSSATAALRNKTVQNGGFKNLNLDEFLSVAAGSDSKAAIIIGTSEGTRTREAGKLPAYGKHNDPGDGKVNIGSFSYNAERWGIPVSGPEEADRVVLRDMNNQRATYEAKVRAAGLDPNNSLLASAFFDGRVQSQRSGNRFLRPDNLKYLKENGINQQTIAEARFRSWINPATGKLYRTDKGGYQATGFANMARKRFGTADPSEEQIQQVARDDQARRVGKLVEALKAQGFTDNSATTAAPSAPTPSAPTARPSNQPTAAPATTRLPVPTANLERGERGRSVKQLQTALVDLGFMTKAQMKTGPGNFGPRTEKALRAFQKANGLEPDGRYGAKTQEALRRALGGTTTPPQPQPQPTTPPAPASIAPNNPVGTNQPAAVGSGAKPVVSRQFTELFDVKTKANPHGHYQMSISGIGTVRVTEGFMVKGPHSDKTGIQAILGDGSLRSMSGKINLGIDYVVQDPQKRVKNWFGGEVVKTIKSSSGYGNRVVVKSDLTYNFNGKNYPVYTHYAHLDRIDVKEKQRIAVGDSVGIMGNTGGSHGAHVDQRFWIETPQGKIDLSPNLLVNVK